jgi:hypothetical protein
MKPSVGSQGRSGHSGRHFILRKSKPRFDLVEGPGRAANGRAGRSSQRSSLTILPQPACLAPKSSGHPQQPRHCRTPLGAFSFRVWTDYDSGMDGL